MHLADTSTIEYHSVMKRTTVHKEKLGSHKDNGFVPGTLADRIGMVWPLTREIASLSPHHDAERRLQRHVTRLKRRRG